MATDQEKPKAVKKPAAKKVAAKAAPSAATEKKTATKAAAVKKTATSSDTQAAAKTAVAKKSAASAQSGRVKLTLVRSTIGRLEAHKACVRGLGLRKTGSSSIVLDTPENRGMINKVSYMLKVEEA